jgi:MFS family permease
MDLPGGKHAAPRSGFAPLRERAFRRMWLAQFVSNLGGWMQTVGAQWLMLSLTSSATFLALIQSAASLPVLLFAIPAGALGDLVDRRRLLLVSQACMLAASVALAVLAATGGLTPWALLALLFIVGSGQAWTSPTWQSLQPELVAAEDRPQAIALGAVNQNLARAVGPALGGALVAATEPSLAFAANALTFLAVLGVIAMWREQRSAASPALPPEHVRAAIRASGRYVTNSPALRAVLLRCAVFIVFASALWALLPAIAHDELGLDSGGYGLLLGCVGVGAVGGAFALPRLRGAASPDRILIVSSWTLAAATAVLAYVHVVALVALAMVLAGIGWILALATLNSTYQALLPGWVKARGLAYYLVVFQGGMAIGSAIIGILAGPLGISSVLTAAAVMLVLGPLATSRRPIPTIAPEALLPSGDRPAVHAPADDFQTGPILVTVTRQANPGATDALTAAVLGLRRMRRRTGATAWSCWADPANVGTVLEQFVVTSWEDHERQIDRTTVRDRQRLTDAAALSADVTIAHWQHVVAATPSAA